MDFDSILEKVDSNGRYQRLLLNAFLTPLSVLPPFFALNIVFLVSVPDHWCHVPGREGTNLSLQEWKDITLPREQGPDGGLRFSQCQMYNVSSITLEDKLLEISNITEYTRNQSITACTHGWEFDTRDYSRTAATDNVWVCDKKIRSTTVLSFNAVGVVGGTLIFGQLADRIGRRPVMYMTILVVVIFRTASLFLARYYELFLVLHFIASTCFPMVYFAPLNIVTEISGVEVRGRIITQTFVAWVFGMCFIPLVAWLSGDWIVIGLITTLPGLLVLVYCKFVPESPRWLMSQGRVKEAADTLETVAKVNGMEGPPRLLDSLSDVVKTPEKRMGILSLFKSRRLATKTILITITYMVNTLLYYGLQWNIRNMGGNEFLNFFLLSIIELPSCFLGWWVTDKFGRRWTHAGFFALAFLCCLINAAISTTSGLKWLMIATCVMGKFCITATFLVLCIQAVELYPTCVRSSGISFSSMTAQLVTMSAAYIVFLGNVHLSIPYIIFGGFCLLGSVAASFLPETLKQPLTETLQEAEEFGRNQKYFGWKVSCEGGEVANKTKERIAMSVKEDIKS